MIRRPGLLNASLTEIARLEPTAASVTAKMVGAGEATLTLTEDAPAVHVHDWVSMYTRAGFAGYYRVTNVAQTFRRQIDVSLLFGIDILSDSVWPEQTDFSGTKAQFLTQLLDKQTQLINGVKPWQLGTCADTSSIERSINYDRLSTLLEALEVEGSNYYLTYDQTTWPWTINYVAKTNTVSSEFRLTRNVRTATITYNDADLCTRLYLSVSSKNEDTVTVKKKNPLYIDDETTPGVPALVDDNITVSYTDSAVRTYNNNAAQADWGIVTKTADIDTHDDIAEQHFASADAWAANYLALRAEPSVQIQIDGDTLREITGSSWDETSIGALCQVALPDYGHTFREYVVSITYPDLVKDETHVTVSLANTLPKVSESIATARAEAATASRSSRANARAAADAKEVTRWSQIVKYQGDALDGSGVLTLYESGIDMDATGGVTIYSLQQGLQGLYSGIKVNANEIEAQSSKISLIINADNSLNVGSIVGGINEQTGQSIWRISADMIELNAGTVLATTLDARLADVDSLFTQAGYAQTIYTNSINTGTVWANTIHMYNGEEASSAYSTYSQKSIYIGNQIQDMTFLGCQSNSASFTISDPVTGFGTATSDATTGEVTIPFYTHNYPSSAPNTGNKINFNIANMAFYINHVGIDETNLTVTEIGRTPYDASTATEITGIAAGTSDKYFLVAATPKAGDTVYKKFTLPAASAPPVTASIDDISGTALASNQIMDTAIPISATGTNVSAYSENAALENSIYTVGSLTRHCVNLKLDSTVIGRISTESVYTDGQSSVTVNTPTCGESTPAVGSTSTRAVINIKATASNNASNNKNFSLQKNTYNSGVHCVNLLENTTIIGRVDTESVYTDGQGSVSAELAVASSGSATPLNSGQTYALYRTINGTRESTPLGYFSVPGTSAASINNLSGSAIATNYLLSTVPITASGTNVSDYTENVTLAKTTYNSGTPCVTLSIDSTVIGRISTQSVYQDGQNSVTVNQPTCGESTPAVSDSAIRTIVNIKATASNSASNNRDFTLERSTYNNGAHCVNLKEGSTVIGRISTELVYTAGRNSVTVTSISRVANCSFNQSNETAIQDVQLTLSNGNTVTIENFHFDDIYSDGLHGRSQTSQIELEAELSSGGSVFTTQDELYLNVADIYQQGVNDAGSTTSYRYIYATTNTGNVAMRSAPNGQVLGRLYSNTRVTYVSTYNSDWTQVSYDGYTGYIRSNYNSYGDYVHTTPKTGVSVVTSGWHTEPGGGGGDQPDPGKTITSVSISAIAHNNSSLGKIAVSVCSATRSAPTTKNATYVNSTTWNLPISAGGYKTTSSSVGTYLKNNINGSRYAGHAGSAHSGILVVRVIVDVSYSDGSSSTECVQTSSYPY